MSIRILSMTGEEIPAITDLPKLFNGWRIPGGKSTSYVNSSGIYTVQEISQPAYSIRYHDYQVKEKAGLWIERNEEGLNTIAVLGKPFRHTIGGVGRFMMSNGLFSTLLSGRWESILNFEYADPLVILETQWSLSFLEKFVPGDSMWAERLSRPLPGIPVIIGYPYRRVTEIMQQLIEQVVYSPYKDSLREQATDELMKEYLWEVLQEANNDNWLNGIISSSDLEKIEHAKQLIAGNMDVHHYTVDIAAAVAMNECKLKALFRKVTGMGTFDYLMYLRCSAVRDQIISTDLPLKTFIQQAGYRDLANFVTGFRRHMGISPAALRRK